MSRLACPTCKTPLIQVPFRQRTRHICPARHGLALTFSALRHWTKVVARPELDQALAKGKAGKRQCSRCSKLMQEFRYSGTTLDHCATCSIVWFDAGELEALPQRTEEDLAREENAKFSQAVKEGWDFQAGLSPFENIEGQSRETPAFTFLLAIAFIALSYVARTSNSGLFVFSAEHPLRHMGIPALLSLFVHADIWHFLGNAFFLVTAGGILETTLGAATMLRIFLFAGLAGNIAFSLFGGGYIIGASGGISGLVIALALTQPNGSYVMKDQGAGLRGFFTLTTTIPLWFWGALFFLEQFLYASFQASGLVHSRTAYLAHAGGALAGLLYVFATDLKVLVPKKAASGTAS